MNRPHPLRKCLLAAPLLLTLWTAAPAQAQPGAKGAPVPPTPKQPDTPPIIMNYLLMLVLVGGIIGANAIPSKRGHQD